MKQSTLRVSLLVVLGIVLAGCSRQDDPMLASRPDGPVLFTLTSTGEPSVVTSNVINTFRVQFDGRVVANGQTTFLYTVSGTGGMHSLSHFQLELPPCAPAPDSFSPPGAVINEHPTTGIFGIKWDLSVGANDSRSYSVTFPGDVPLGAIRSTVKAATDIVIGEIGGPCNGFEISGTVYVDADSNGVRDGADEPGIINVTVTAVDAGGALLVATSDAEGHYAFVRLPGTYTIRIDASTPADDFNENLAENFDASGPTSTQVTVGPASQGNDFGFAPQAGALTADIQDGIILTDGEPPKFWIKHLRAAIGGRNMGKLEFNAGDIDGFLVEIQTLFLPVPFQFTPGNEREEALAILQSKSKEDLDRLLKQLLAAEFNEVSGKGLIGEEELQSVMISWGESVYFANASQTFAVGTKGGTGTIRAGGTISVKDAQVFFGELNNDSTGGGGSGGGGG